MYSDLGTRWKKDSELAEISPIRIIRNWKLSLQKIIEETAYVLRKYNQEAGNKFLEKHRATEYQDLLSINLSIGLRIMHLNYILRAIYLTVKAVQQWNCVAREWVPFPCGCSNRDWTSITWGCFCLSPVFSGWPEKSPFRATFSKSFFPSSWKLLQP